MVGASTATASSEVGASTLQLRGGGSPADRPRPCASDSRRWDGSRNTCRSIGARMPWQVIVEEIGKNRKVQDDAPDDCQDSVLPHARGSVVLPVPEEARNHDREGQTQ